MTVRNTVPGALALLAACLLAPRVADKRSNDNLTVDQVSLFYAGALAPHHGMLAPRLAAGATKAIMPLAIRKDARLERRPHGPCAIPRLRPHRAGPP